MGTPAAPSVTPATDANARRHGRVRLHLIESSLGTIVDLSASGMKILARSKPPVQKGATVPLRIEGVNGPFVVMSKIVWVRRVGIFKHEVGVTFEDVNGQVRKSLSEIAATSSRGEVMRPEEEHFLR